MAKTTLANLIVNLLFDSSAAEKSIMGFAKSIESMGAKIQSVGMAMTKAFTVPLTAAGTAATVMASQYDDSIKKISALTAASSEDIAQWSNEMQSLGMAVGKSPRELSDAMFAIASAGIKGKEAMELLTASAKGSAAGLGDTLSVAKVGIGVLNAYGTANITGAKAMDVLVETAKQANTSVDALAPVMGRVLPIAAELDVSFSDVGATMARLTLISGDANMAATQFGGVLRALLKPTAEAEKALEKAGISTQELRKTIKEKGLLSALELLRDKFRASGQELSTFFSDTEGLSGALQLVGDHASGVRDTFEAVGSSTGALDKAYSITEGLSRELLRGWASIEVLGTKIGQAILPIVSMAVDQLSAVVAMAIPIWDSLAPGIQQAVVVFGMIVAAAGPVIVVIGTVVGAMAPLVAAFAAFIGFVGPMIPFILAGVALALGGLFAFFTAWTSKAVTIPQVLQTLGLQLLAGLSNLAAQAINALMPQMDATGESVRAWIVEFSMSTMESLGGVLSSVSGWMVSFGSAIVSGIASQLGPPIQTALDTIYTQMTGKTAEFPSKLAEIFAIANAASQQAMQYLSQSMGGWADVAADFVLQTLQKASQKIWDWVNAEVQSMIDTISSAWSDTESRATSENQMSPQVAKHVNSRATGAGGAGWSNSRQLGDSPERAVKQPVFLGQNSGGGGAAADKWLAGRQNHGEGAAPDQSWLQSLNQQIGAVANNGGGGGGGQGGTAFEQWMNSRGSNKAETATTQTITVNLDGRQIARNVVKNMPSAIAAETGFRGSM